MNNDFLNTNLTDGIAVIRMGSEKRIFLDAEMTNALTTALEEFAPKSWRVQLEHQLPSCTS